MKQGLRRAASKIAGIIFSWAVLKFLLFALTLIILLYAEEDWRGARTWAATKAKWETHGETFDLAKFIPPPIPDDQNLAAIPLFKMEPDPRYSDQTVLYPLTLLRAMYTEHGPEIQLPSKGNWMKGELPNLPKINQAIAEEYAELVKGTPPPDPLAQFNAIYPFLAELRDASATRQQCRFDLNFATSPPAARSMGLLTYQLRLSNLLTLHAILALDHKQPDVALADITTSYTLLSGVKRDPSFVGALVAVGINAVCGAAIYDGLALHAWNDTQLASLQRLLSQVDFLSVHQFAMRSEIAEDVLDIDYIKHRPHSEQYGYLFGQSDTPPAWFLDGVPQVWPRGWWDQNISRVVTMKFNYLTLVDPLARRVYPSAVSDLEKHISKMSGRWDAGAPWNLLAIIMSTYLPSEPAKFAYGQTWIDEEQLAIALERYRLAQNAYPATLDALVPAFINALPHDLIKGEPYHYRLNADGTFLLYSVGWNQKDDGGKAGLMAVNPKLLDQTQGDWVWPTPQKSTP